jgi:serine/threonine protein kinase
MTSLFPLKAGMNIGGHYRVEELINTGGFGSVYRGLALSENNRPCAIKETYDVTPAARRQALMEAAILFTIKSAHLPEIYDAFEEQGRFYLVMQLIEGQNCAQLVKMRGGPCAEREVLDWLLPIADVLQELHSRNPPVLHRDIKPANIIVQPQGQAVLVDFGLTRLYDPTVATRTLARAVSEGFSPLEQYVGQTSPRSDVYALAATMYFLLTAQVPPAAVARSMDDRLVPLRQLNPQISPQVAQAVFKALAVNDADRPVSMQAFARALRAPATTVYADQSAHQSKQNNQSNQSSYQQANALTEVAPPLIPPPPPPSSLQPLVLPPVPAMPQRHTGNPSAVRKTLPPRPLKPRQRQRYDIPPPAGGAQMGNPYGFQQHQPLPSPFHQGCLWGLLQGCLSALLIILLHAEKTILFTFVEGFLCYFLAGLCTMRRGGRLRRAARAGFWAGVISTLAFWVGLFAGLTVQAVQAIDAARRIDGVRLTFNQAFNQVKPPLLVSQAPPASNQQNLDNLLIFLLIGLVCAIGFALLGGLLGHPRRRKRW